MVIAVDANVILSALLGGKSGYILWSQDKDFERAQYHKLLKTYQFL